MYYTNSWKAYFVRLRTNGLFCAKQATRVLDFEEVALVCTNFDFLKYKISHPKCDKF